MQCHGLHRFGQANPPGLNIYAEGLSYKEAAAALDVPIGTIMSRLAAARAKLAQLNDESAADRKNRGQRK